MNLLYTLTAYPPYMGGAQLHQHLLAQSLSERHQIQVVSQWDHNRTDWLLGTTLRAPSESRDYVLDGINVHRFGLTNREKLPLIPSVLAYYPLMDVALPPIAACLERHIGPFADNVDLIHNVRIGREGISFASLQAARKRNIPFVLTPVHHPRWVGWRYRAFDSLYRLADAVLALTEAEKSTLIAIGVQEEKITIIGHGPILAEEAFPDRFLTDHQIDGPMVLFVGQHYLYKGYRQLLETAPLVWEHVPEAHFVFIGPAVKHSEETFKNLADRRIHRLGMVSLQDKTNVLAACDVMCLPSTQESFGGVYAEAWSFAKPVIGCNIPAVAEVISDGEDGYLVNQDTAEIADKVLDLLLNPGRAKQMGKVGRQKVIQHYSWPKIAQRVENAYSVLLDGPK